jgi:hypothetical protein
LAEMTNSNSPNWTPTVERFDADDLIVQPNIPGPRPHDLVISMAEESPKEDFGTWTGRSNNGLITTTANASRYSRDSRVAPRRHSAYSHPKRQSWSTARNAFGQRQGVTEELNTSEETIWAPPVPIKHLLRAAHRHAVSSVQERTQGKLWSRRPSSLPQLNPGGLWSGSPQPSLRREHREFVLQPAEMPRKQRVEPSQPEVTFADQNGLWKPPIRLIQPVGKLWQPPHSAQPEISHIFTSTTFNLSSYGGSESMSLVTQKRTGLWTPQLRSPPTIPTTGLWSRDSASFISEIRSHQEWINDRTVRSVSMNKVRDGVNDFPPGYRNGLWKKPPVASTTGPGLWKSKSLPRISLHDPLLPPFPSTAFLDNSPFLVDVRSSSAYPSELEVTPLYLFSNSSVSHNCH